MKKKRKLPRIDWKDVIATDPMRRFVYGLLTSISNLQRSGMVKPKPKRITVTDCAGCRDLFTADKRSVIPIRCPQCGRPTTESVREFWLATERRTAPADGAYTPGYRRAKKR